MPERDESQMLDAGTPTVRAWTDMGVGVIEFNRPERSNALHPDMYEAVPRLLEQFTADDSVGCILITAAGKAFCAGGDVQAGVEANRQSRRSGQAGEPVPRPSVEDHGTALAHNARMVLMMHESPKVTIAALPGPAVGAGVGIALAADFRIAAQSTRLVTGWGNLAFSGDFGGTWFLTRMLGSARALDLLLNNGRIDADQALSWGLFNRVVPDADLREAALHWARTIAAGPRNTYRLMKENVRDNARLGLREALPLESARMAESGQSDDHRQAVKRWLKAAEEKREQSQSAGVGTAPPKP
ncbi:MAG: crt 1 [Acidimicrobiia bacterium]|nr:crt 1 [Acidimicrobiia bacterium]